MTFVQKFFGQTFTFVPKHLFSDNDFGRTFFRRPHLPQINKVRSYTGNVSRKKLSEEREEASLG